MVQLKTLVLKNDVKDLLEGAFTFVVGRKVDGLVAGLLEFEVRLQDISANALTPFEDLRRPWCRIRSW